MFSRLLFSELFIVLSVIMGDKSLQALLRFSVEAGSHGSDPTRNVNSADKAWLNEALREYEIDPVQHIKQLLSTVHRYLSPSKKEDEEIDTDQVYEALEGISDNCDQYDLAGDLHKIGGFDVMIKCMKHKDSGVCWRACDVLATAAQNHEYCQNALVEMQVLPIVLSMVDDTAADDKVREKAFYALSCIVRGNEKALEHLQDNNGFSTLIRTVQSDVSRLKMKAVFFIKSLCEGDAKCASLFHDLGIEQQLVGMLRNRNLVDSPESVNLIENLLGCLLSLISTYNKSRKECRDPSFGLSKVLSELKEKFSSGEEFQECIGFCDKILETCFQDDADDQ